MTLFLAFEPISLLVNSSSSTPARALQRRLSFERWSTQKCDQEKQFLRRDSTPGRQLSSAIPDSNDITDFAAVHLSRRSIYNEEDRSIQDIDTSLSFVHCDRAEIPHCDSCENNLAYAVASEIKQDQIAGKEQEEKKEKNWTPIRLDGDNENSFRYANRQYHKHDFILLSPQEVTLPNAPPSDPRRWPFRLAQLVSISPESSPQPSQSPEVTNLGRLSKLKVRWVIRRSETGKVASFQSERELLITDIVDEGIDVNRLEGHFNLHHISQVRTITENQNDHEALALYQRDNLNFFFDSKIERKDGAPLQVHGEHEVLSARASQLQEVTVEAGAIEHCDVCRKEEEDIRGRDRRIGEALRSKRGDRLAMKSLSLYSGGGGLDIGLGLVSLVSLFFLASVSSTDSTYFTDCRDAKLSRLRRLLRSIEQLCLFLCEQSCYSELLEES